ncbi:MAG: hypothetical protein AAFQ90_12715 [Pseudomonadota bacterium]
MDLQEMVRRHLAEAADRMLIQATTSTATSSTSSISADSLMAEMQRIRAALGPPPPQVRLSKHIPPLIAARPSAQPRTGDMQTMVDNIGPQLVPGGYRIGDMVFVNPIHFKEG